MSDNTDDAQRNSRITFADTLSEFNEQRHWYSARAGQFKKRAQGLDLFIIGCGALIAVLPVLESGSDPHWSEILVSFLGAAVVLGQGAQRVFRYSDIWPEYRLASERMKREWRLFINGFGQYSAPEDEARSQYIHALDAIMAEEQQIFFDAQRSQSEPDDSRHE